MINHDAQAWKEAWNAHKMRLPDGQPRASPHELFLFGMVDFGPRGIDIFAQPEVINPADLAAFGTDVSIHEDGRAMNHFLENNPDAWDAGNPFNNAATVPDHTNEIIVEPPSSPLAPEQIAILDHFLTPYSAQAATGNMVSRKLLWQVALDKCHDLLRT